MELSALVVAPGAAGALLYIIDMLLPDSRLAQVASAVAGIVVVHALLTPVLGWLAGADMVASDDAYLNAQQVLTAPAQEVRTDDLGDFYYYKEP